MIDCDDEAEYAMRDTTGVEFQKEVQRIFSELQGRNIPANRAAAYALRIAAGGGEVPLTEKQLWAIVRKPQKDMSLMRTLSAVEAFLSCPLAIFLSFWGSLDSEAPSKQDPQGVYCVQDEPINFSAMKALFKQLMDLKETAVARVIDSSLRVLMLACRSLSGQMSGADHARLAALLFANPLLQEVEHRSLMSSTISYLVQLKEPGHTQVVQLLSRFSREDLEGVLATVQHFVTLTLFDVQAINEEVRNGTRCLNMIHRANLKSQLLSPAEFYNDAINTEEFNIENEFKRWKQGEFSFCNYPFVLGVAAKGRLIQLEAGREQVNECMFATMCALMKREPLDMFLTVVVRRGPLLLEDTLVQLHKALQRGVLKKPLKVKFVGEDGVDEGGVQKEFFLLLVRQVFSPDFMMFRYDEHTRLYWFHPACKGSERVLELVGLMIGLAIFNNHILDFSFPLVMYKKLHGEPVSYDDLEELYPDVHQNLKKLMDYQGEVEDLELYFQICTETPSGSITTTDLVPDGGQVKVTAANRAQYGKLYAHHLLDISVAEQFSAFQRGFLRLCDGEAWGLLTPSELQTLICGSPLMDLAELEDTALYEDGYTVKSQVIQWFWSIVHEMTDHQKKRLLMFVTGSDRVPIKGLGHLAPPFTISRQGPHSERLPTAHTCFNHLLLPQYDDEQSLRARLMLAIENAEGFGLM